MKSGLYFSGFWFICSEFNSSCRLFFSSFRFVTGAVIASAVLQRSFTSCPQLWSLAQLSHGSWSLTDVSMPWSAPRSLFWSSGEGLWRVFLGLPGSTWPGSPAEGKPHKPRLSRDNLDDCLVTQLLAQPSEDFDTNSRNINMNINMKIYRSNAIIEEMGKVV